jgi:hypothetical protein
MLDAGSTLPACLQQSVVEAVSLDTGHFPIVIANREPQLPVEAALKIYGCGLLLSRRRHHT